MEQDGTRLLFDPFLSLNDKVFKPPVDELSGIDNILVTHGHLDHVVDIPTVLERGNGRAVVYCTASPQKALVSKGVREDRIRIVTPGDVLTFGPFEVRVLKGKHIVFNKRLLIKTFLNPRVCIYWNNLKYMLKENKIFSEAGETVIYEIEVSKKRVFLMGSLNLDDHVEYRKSADLLILPFQGRSDVCKYTLPFVDHLQPKRILLDHFDNTFPPISSAVKMERFLSLMRRKHPDIPVICPQASEKWIENPC